MAETELQTIREKLKGMTLFVIPYTHPDWSWCHSRQWHERRYVAVFEEALVFLKQDAAAAWYMDCFVTELLPLLERKPELLPELRAAVASGRIAVCGAFSNIRPNMAADEAFVRNLIIGREKFLEVFPGADLSVHADAVDVALGHPQMPQLLLKAGYIYFRAGRPYEVLRKKGIPHAFVWEGVDKSRILCWWAQYDALCSRQTADIINADGGWEGKVVELYNREMKKLTEASTVDIAWLPQGSDDGLPGKRFNSGEAIDFTGFMKTWNERETSTMRFATPPSFFTELEKRKENIPTVAGTIDPCDVCYNAAWGGEKGLAPLRLKSAQAAADAEKWMAAAKLAGLGEPADTRELWEMALTASAHASQWVFEEDRDELFGFAENCLCKAEELKQNTLRKITEAMRLPANTLAALFNAADTGWNRPVEMTLPCGNTESLELRDGRGELVEYQILEPYEYDGEVFEQRVLVRPVIPSLGTNIIAAAKGDVSCRRGAPYQKPEKPASADTAGDFTMENGVLRLLIRNGNLVTVTDLRSGNQRASGGVCWNTLEFVGIDTDKGGLHAGPETGRERVVWQSIQRVESGPLRWRCSLKGTDGIRHFTQDILLEAGSDTILFETNTDGWPVCAGYLAARIPAGKPCRLTGGIPFGSEEKDIDNEPYNGREEGWSDFHRQWDGLFFAKDYAAAHSDGCAVALCHLSGDRYYIYEKKNDSLGCLLINCAVPYKGTCEENMNCGMFQSPGRHRFRHAVIVAGPGAADADFIAASAALRQSPVVIRPYRNPAVPAAIQPYGSFMETGPANVRLSAAYFDGGDMIVRLWEAGGQNTKARLALYREAASVKAENFIGEEDNTVNAAVEGGRIVFDIRPHEIVTLRVTLKEKG